MAIETTPLNEQANVFTSELDNMRLPAQKSDEDIAAEKYLSALEEEVALEESAAIKPKEQPHVANEKVADTETKRAEPNTDKPDTDKPDKGKDSTLGGVIDTIDSELETVITESAKSIPAGVLGVADNVLNLGGALSEDIARLVGMDYASFKSKIAEGAFPSGKDPYQDFLRGTVTLAGEFALASAIVVGGTAAAGVTLPVWGTVAATGFIVSALEIDPDGKLIQDWLVDNVDMAGDYLYWATSDDDDYNATKIFKGAAFLEAVGGVGIASAQKAFDLFGKVAGYYKYRDMIKNNMTKVRNAKKVATELVEEGAAKKVTGEVIDAKPQNMFNKVTDTPPELTDKVVKQNLKEYRRLHQERGATLDLSKIDDAQIVKEMEEEIAFMTAQHDKGLLGRYKPDAKLLADLEEHGISLEDILTRRGGDPLTQHVVGKTAQIAMGASDDIAIKAQMFIDGKIPYDVFVNDYNLATRIVQQKGIVGTDASGILHVLNAVRVPEHTNTLNRMRFIANSKTLMGEDTATFIAKELVKAGKPARMKMLEFGNTSYYDYLTGIRANYMLSNPLTQAKNIVSTGSHAGMHLAENLIAGGYNSVTGKLLSRNPLARKGIQFSEALAETHGEIMGFIDAIKIMRDNSKAIARLDFEGVTPIFRDTFDKFGDVKSNRIFQDIPWNEMSQTQKGLTSAEYVFGGRIFADMLRMEDNVFKLAAQRAYIYKESVRLGRMSGLKGAKLSNHIRKLKLDPGKDTIKESMNFARKLTFTKETTGAYGGMQQMARKIPGSKLFFPFVRTNLNVIEAGAERIPLLGSFMAENQKLIAQGRYTEVAAKQAFGVTALGGITYMLKSSGFITRWTGSLPNNVALKNMARTGTIREDSITINNKNVSLKMGHPVTQVVGIAADIGTMYQMLDYAYGTENDAVVDEAINTITNQSVVMFMKYLTPDFITEVVSAVNEASIYGNVSPIAKIFAKSMVALAPYNALFRQGNKMLDPVSKQAIVTDGVMGIWDTMKNEFMRVYAPEGLPPRRDFLGYPMPVDNIVMDVNLDPVVQEVIRLSDADVLTSEADVAYRKLIINKTSSMYSPDGQMKPIRMNLNQYDELVMWKTGQHPKWEEFTGGAPTLRDALHQVMQSSEYKESDDFMKTALVRSMESDYASRGRSIHSKKVMITDFNRIIQAKIKLLGDNK